LPAPLLTITTDMEMHPFYLWLDSGLIWFYRLSGSAEVNFLLGTLVLAVLSLLVGEFTAFLASFLVRRHFERAAGEAKRYQDLSMEALKAGDRPAYEAANQVANEAFGKSFFMQVALSATFFWPIFFALAWMQYRFLEIAFPLPFIGFSLGYTGAFVILYIAAYCLFTALRRRLPYFRRLKESMGASARPARNLKGFADLLPPDAAGKPTGAGGPG
jgi:uncharacterized membrane protein (DUF106 family)